MDRWFSPRDLDGKIIELVARARTQYGISEDCSGTAACRHLGIDVHRGPLNSGTDGLLTKGHVLINEALTWPPRIEFTIFHEIVHHLLEEDGEIIEFFTEALRNDDAAFRAAIERCCHQGAAEFLMPQARVRALIASGGFTVDLVERLAAQHGASIVAAAIQLAVCAPVNCFVVLSCFGAIPRSWPPRTGLYVEYAFAPRSVRYTLARFSPIPSDHLLVQVWQTRNRAGGQSYVPFRTGTRMPCHCEAKSFGARVIAILSLERPVPPGQQSLPLGAL